MTIAWHIRGYERLSERMVEECGIPPDQLPIVRANLPEPNNDPGMIDPYELTPDQAARLATALGLSLLPDRFDYFIEADEDWRLVDAKRESLAAAA